MPFEPESKLPPPKPPASEPYKIGGSKPATPESMLFASVVAWSFVVLVLGTIFGVWIKLFWLGWVFAGLYQ